MFHNRFRSLPVVLAALTLALAPSVASAAICDTCVDTFGLSLRWSDGTQGWFMYCNINSGGGLTCYYSHVV